MNSLDIQQQLAADQRRGRYVRVSDIDRRQLIEAYKKGEDFIALAKKLNIKRSTARSILRTYIDEGRVSAKQRAGTRLRFITEDEAEIIREMKRRHPLITIGQIQMRLQRTSNRVLSKASISRILTNSIRLGKRAKRSVDGVTDGQDDFQEKNLTGQDELLQLSSDEGTGGAFYIDEEEEDDDDDDDDETAEHASGENNSALQNLDDFQRFMLRKTSANGDESANNEGGAWNGSKAQYENNDGANYDGSYAITYPHFGSEDDEELSEMDEHESKSPADVPPESTPSHSHLNGGASGDTSTSNENATWSANQSSIKSEPVCVFLNQNYESSDSEQQSSIMEDRTPKVSPKVISSGNALRRIKMCPICGDKNFSRLAHHLTIAHNMNRDESLTLIAHTERSLAHATRSMMATVSSSSPKTLSNSHSDRSPQPTPISITTNNQQITSASLSPILGADDMDHHPIPPINEQLPINYASADGKKRLLCPRCDTWVLNLTDHLIKKHHLLSKQERLPYLRMARNRQTAVTNDKNSTNAFLIPSGPQQGQAKSSPSFLQPQLPAIQPSMNNRQCQNIIKKYRKKMANQTQPSSSTHNTDMSPNGINQNLVTMNNIPSFLAPENLSRSLSNGRANGTPSSINSRDVQQMAVHQKFEQRLSVFRQQFAVTVAMQNSLMQQMELLQRSFVSIEEEWSDMRKEIVGSIS